MSKTDLEQTVTAALADPPQRVRRLDLPDGRRFWLKRVERLSGRLRLQKGDPQKAFTAELRGLHSLADNGLPVAEVVMQGTDWMVLADAGPVLPMVVADPALDAGAKQHALAVAGRALGLLHRAGLVHGRPAVRDICWDGQEARFIDLERFHPGRHGGFWQAADVMMFAQTCFTRWPDDPRWLDSALAGYAAHAPEAAMLRVRRLALGLAPLGWLAMGLSRLRPNSRELRAVGRTLARLRG
ncbi:MAG: serine/threonine protein phosphatase [Rhodobacter sp.]|nr:serine/threonine protein phosphatase [Rhodobacter sp.]